ncbi:unnamed protein product [Kuraishia capsulata CBS 1993]|uniref:Uncharacterized protein n=1 Tax=Kuraishia capsulata CBS 1993 TaxID=1382522 RepID=W6MJ28_9ASCO|nr:uncharacterized protein KUCA_T00000379001 [Kuraishia capsulata CBS 1993]CDK24417.1 unnamed protein product [Kuraishia capsulata CBS 1993]
MIESLAFINSTIRWISKFEQTPLDDLCLKDPISILNPGTVRKIFVLLGIKCELSDETITFEKLFTFIKTIDIVHDKPYVHHLSAEFLDDSSPDYSSLYKVDQLYWLCRAFLDIGTHGGNWRFSLALVFIMEDEDQNILKKFLDNVRKTGLLSSFTLRFGFCPFLTNDPQQSSPNLREEKINLLNEKLVKSEFQLSNCKKELRLVKAENSRISALSENLEKTLSTKESENKNYAQQLHRLREEAINNPNFSEQSQLRLHDKWKVEVLEELVLSMKMKELHQ